MVRDIDVCQVVYYVYMYIYIYVGISAFSTVVVVSTNEIIVVYISLGNCMDE